MKIKKTILILILLISAILYFFVKLNRSLYGVSSNDVSYDDYDDVSSDLVEGFRSERWRRGAAKRGEKESRT